MSKTSTLKYTVLVILIICSITVVSQELAPTDATIPDADQPADEQPADNRPVLRWENLSTSYEYPVPSSTSALDLSEYEYETTTTTSTTLMKIHDVKRMIEEKEIEAMEEEKQKREVEKEGPIKSECGGTDLVCPVEFDTSGDGKLDCCTAETNIMCSQCYDFCKKICARQGVAVQSCTSSDDKPLCRCTDRAPKCYEIQDKSNEKAPVKEIEVDRTSNIFVYLMGLAILAVAIFLGVKLSHNKE